tara:strand:+ start:223 stop:411 length:189 start_codon:yes stop_codon:yes gene_type:complete
MNTIEKLRIEISINMSKRDLKQRWGLITPEYRTAIREEFGEWINKSSFEEENIMFLDYFNDL